jgi:hypothetical protein
VPLDPVIKEDPVLKELLEKRRKKRGNDPFFIIRV